MVPEIKWSGIIVLLPPTQPSIRKHGSCDSDCFTRDVSQYNIDKLNHLDEVRGFSYTKADDIRQGGFPTPRLPDSLALIGPDRSYLVDIHRTPAAQPWIY
jgi:hypothetical protein